MKKFAFYSATAFTAAALVVSATPTAEASFTDLKKEEQKQAVQSLVDRGIVSGYADGTFRPGNQVTRAQAAKILAGVLELDLDNITNPNFKDVPTTHPNYKYIAVLANAGIINGSNGYYKPNNPLKRGQVAKILTNSFDLQGSAKLPFTDVAGTGYEEFIEALYANEVTTGKTPTTFGVNDTVTRGQLAVFIHRIENMAGDVVEDVQPELTDDVFTFSAEQFGYDHIVGDVFSTLSEGVVEVTYNADGDYTEVTVEPLQEGTDFIYIAEFDN